MYAFFWILIGLVLIGLLVGDISSTLTSYCLSSTPHIVNNHILVLNETEAHRYVTQNSGTPVPVANVEQFIAKLKENPKGGLAGGLLDAYVAGHYESVLSLHTDVEFGAVFNHEYAQGMVLTLETYEPALDQCLRKYRQKHERKITRQLLENMKAYRIPETSSEVVRSQSLISSKNKTFQHLCIACIGISVLLLLFVGLLQHMDVIKTKRRNTTLSFSSATNEKVSKKDIYCHLYRKQCSEMEKFVIEEVLHFYESFKNGIDGLKLMDTKVAN